MLYKYLNMVLGLDTNEVLGLNTNEVLGFALHFISISATQPMFIVCMALMQCRIGQSVAVQ